MSGSDLIFLNSPVDLLEKFTDLLQKRFSDGRLPWTWHHDEGSSGIFVTSELSIPKDFSDAAPAIIVTRGSFAHMRAVVGDDDQNNKDRVTKGAKNFWSPAEGDMRVECIGQTKGESTLIADVVRTTIHMTREPICAAFSLRDISAVVMQPTVPYDRDKTKWVTRVDFRVEFEERWFNVVAAPPLRKLGLEPSHVDRVDIPELVPTPKEVPTNSPLLPGPDVVPLGGGATTGLGDAVWLHSPLNLLAQFTSLFRTRFADGHLPWRWHHDEGTTGIFIEAEFSRENEATNASPAITVTRGSVVYRRDVVGDEDQNNKDRITKGGKNFWSAGETDLRVEIIGQTMGEAALIADVVASTVHMTREPICEAFSLRDISPVTAGRVVPYERDKTKWVTHVDFRVYFEERWFGVPAAPSLRKLRMTPTLDSP